MIGRLIILCALLCGLAACHPKAAQLAATRAGGGIARGEDPEREPLIQHWKDIFFPGSKPQVVQPLFKSGPPRDCPSVLSDIRNRLCPEESNKPFLLGSCFSARRCNADQSQCIADHHAEDACLKEEADRAVQVVKAELPRVATASARMESAAEDALAELGKFAKAGGCPEDYTPTEMAVNYYVTTRDQFDDQVKRVGDAALLVKRAGREAELAQEAGAGSVKAQLSFRPNPKAANVMDAVITLAGAKAPADTSWGSTEHDHITGFPGVWGPRLTPEPPIVTIGRGETRVISQSQNWTNGPHLGHPEGHQYKGGVGVPDGYRFCKFSFVLRAKSNVCKSQVTPDASGVAVEAWIRGDDTPTTTKGEGEFHYDLALTVIDTPSTSCQAKRAGCVDPAAAFSPAGGAVCSNVGEFSATNGCHQSFCDDRTGLQICRDGRKDDKGQCVPGNPYVCGYCQQY